MKIIILKKLSWYNFSNWCTMG